jgi:hypothetical protein
MTQANNPLSLDEFIDVEVFTQEISEDITDLNEAMRKQTSRAAYYGMRAASAKTQAARIDNIVKATEAKLKVEHRRLLTEEAVKLAEDEGGKPERITAEMVQSAVFTDPRMLKLLQIQLEADEIKTVCNVASDAFRTRRDMLKSLGHLAIEQMRGPMRMTGGTTDPLKAADEYRARRAARGGGAIPGDE